MLILDLRGVSFHAAVVFGLSKDFLFKSRTLWESIAIVNGQFEKYLVSAKTYCKK